MNTHIQWGFVLAIYLYHMKLWGCYPIWITLFGWRHYLRYTRFEKARIIGARALQISMGAPILIDPPEGMLNPVHIALLEYEKGVIPISVKR